MKKGWEIKKMGEVCEVIAGQSPEGKYYNDIGEGLPFYQGKKAFTKKFIDEPTKWTTKITKEAIENDILMSVRAPVGPINYSTQKICIGRGLAAIRASKKIEREYLYYFLIKHENEIVGNTGAVFNSINKSQIGAIQIPLSPLPEQQRIVAILDKAFTAIDKAKANAEQNLLNAKELFENSLQLLFDNKDWEHKKLGEIADFKNGMNFTKNSKGQSIKIVGVKNFKNNFWVPFQKLEEVVIDGKFNEAYLLKRGDIITVRSNGNPKLIGRTLLADSVTGNISHSGFTIRIRLNADTLLPLFLCNYLKTQKTRKELVDSGNGVGIKSLNQGSLSSLMIPFPKTQIEQQQIVKKLNSLSIETKKLEAIYEQKITDLDELKKSILQKAFRGEL